MNLHRLLRLASALLALAGLPCAVHAQGTRVLVQTYLNVNDTRGLVHDGDRLWIATGGGLVSYEPSSGETATFHRSSEGLASDSLSGVAVGADGRIWCATERMGISIYDPAAEVWEAFTSLFWPIPGDRIQRLSIHGDTLNVGTAQGFAVFVDLDLREVCLQGVDDLRCRLPSYDIRDVVADPQGNGVWLATAQGVCHRAADGSLTLYDDGVTAPLALRLVRHRGGWIAAFPEGIFSLQEAQQTWQRLAGPTGLADGFIDFLSEGETLWAATSAGVWRREGDGSFEQVGDPAFPASSLLRGPDGTLWAGGRDVSERKDGVWRLEGATWSRHAFPGPSSRANYRAIAFDANGVLTVSHARSGSIPMRQTFDGSTWSAPVDLDDWTFDLLFAPQGDLWLAQCCCRETGCNLHIVVDGVSEALPPRNLRDIVYDAQGNLWGASDQAPDQEEHAQGIWFRDAGSGEWVQVTRESSPDLLRNRVRAVLPVGRDLWIGYSDRGVHRWDLGPDHKPLTIDDGAWTLYSTETPSRRLIADNVTRLRIQGTRIWVGTTGGLSLIDPGKVTNVGAGFLGLPGSVVNDVVPLADGGAWVATQNTGVTRMTLDGTGFDFTTFGPPDLPHPNVETLALGPDGVTIWAGTSRGLARLAVTREPGISSASLAAYPNPYVPGCTDGIRLIGVAGSADGIVVDVTGKVVRRFAAVQAGQPVWDGKDGTGAPVAPGLYWIRASSAEGNRAVGVGVGDGSCPD